MLGLFAVLGAIGTVITIYSFLAPASDEQRILARSVDHALAYRSRTFPMDVTVEGIDAGNEDLLQTDLTLWRDGGKPITADMVRRPLRVTLPSGSRAVALKIVSKESSVPDNFKVDRDGSDVLLSWKVFDPDMALKLAIVRSGSSIDVRVSSDVGPGIVVTASRFSGLKRVGLFSLTLLLAVSLLGVLGLGLVLFFTLSNRWEKHVRSSIVRTVIFLFVLVVLIAALLEGTAYAQRAIDWVTARSVAPIPFE